MGSLKGGLPTSNANKMQPRDHMSDLRPCALCSTISLKNVKSKYYVTVRNNLVYPLACIVHHWMIPIWWRAQNLQFSISIVKRMHSCTYKSIIMCQQQIGQFQIPVNDTHGMQILQAKHNLSQKISRLVIRNLLVSTSVK